MFSLPMMYFGAQYNLIIVAGSITRVSMQVDRADTEVDRRQSRVPASLSCVTLGQPVREIQWQGIIVLRDASCK